MTTFASLAQNPPNIIYFAYFRKSLICAVVDSGQVLCYSIAMGTGGCILGGTFSTVMSAVLKALGVVGEFLGKIIYYFGLYFPIAYAIYGVVLYFTFDFNPFIQDVDGKLFMFGFSLSCVAMVIQAVKNIIINPCKKYFSKSKVVEYGKEQKLAKNAPEAPTIYKSKVNPGVIVYEYSNRYDLYEEFEDGLRLVNTEYKGHKGKRW